MQPNPAEVMEWHIFETPMGTQSTGSPLIQMGPFASEEECRTVLSSLEKISGFHHGVLQIRQQVRRCEKRIRIKLLIQIYCLAAPGKSWGAHTVDISRLGACLVDQTGSLKPGEYIGVRYGQREAVFRIVRTGLPGSPTATHVGVECLSPEINIWDLDFSGHSDDAPLMEEIVIARSVQRKLFPREKPRLRTLDYSGKCIQARTVGGDYYDFLNMGQGQVGFVLADVSGKGVSAALLMANLQGSIHNRVGISVDDLPGFLSAVNLHLFEHTEPERYATLFVGCYDDDARKLAYVNCGHSPPLLLRQNGEMERLDATATVLGLFGTWSCSVGEISMKSGDILSIFSDGITETTSANGDEFGEGRLLDVLQNSRDLKSAEILQHVEQAVESFRSSEQLQDDVTLVVARAQ